MRGIVKLINVRSYFYQKAMICDPLIHDGPLHACFTRTKKTFCSHLWENIIEGFCRSSVPIAGIPGYET